MQLPKHFQRFDAQQLIQNGVEPYHEIRRWLDQLPPEVGLAVTLPEPPLLFIETTEEDGFHTRLERADADAWTVYLWRDGAPRQ